jgi:hypothetical protein
MLAAKGRNRGQWPADHEDDRMARVFQFPPPVVADSPTGIRPTNQNEFLFAD